MNNLNYHLISAEITVHAPIETVWEAWTTEHGVKRFFAPDCFIESKPGGAYEMYFDPSAPAGLRGGEGCRILAMQKPSMLSFTWNNPPELEKLRETHQNTHVLIRLEVIAPQDTRVILMQDGWGTGEDWEKAYAYFSKAWSTFVLPRLKLSLEQGPIQWD